MAPDRTEGRTVRPGLSGHAMAPQGRVAPAPHSRAGTTFFSDWLRVQLRSRRMSQRHLASRSGVNHATISRILREHRDPSLGTAMSLARVLLELDAQSDDEHYVALLSGMGATTPPRRVEHALRADKFLDEVRIRGIMDYYLSTRQVARRDPSA